MNVIAFPQPEKFSLPKILRELADKFEAGEYPEPTAFAYVAENDEGLVSGLIGQTSEVHACGLFTIAAHFMAQEACE